MISEELATRTSLRIHQVAGADVAASMRTTLHPGALRDTTTTAITARTTRRSPVTAATAPRRPRSLQVEVAAATGTRRSRRRHTDGGTEAEAKEETRRAFRRRRKHEIKVMAAVATVEAMAAKASRMHRLRAVVAQNRLRLPVEKAELTKTESLVWPRQSPLLSPLRVDANCVMQKHLSGRRTWGTRPPAVAGRAAQTTPKSIRREAVKERKRVVEVEKRAAR